ncbi:hypothetical protein V6N11_025145 [Hibiscus sabdariffa]|uniref:Reverse transcriptase zinc-binding domain-containing protein n=1 Tax=Hibiscus sabdariffa TaxID=183260 RepID=A0ABR2QPL2_9ROSI
MWRVFQILFEEPVPLPVMAALFAVLAVLRLSSPRCAFVVVNSVTNVDVGTAKMPHPGARCALLLTALILVMIVHCRSSSPSSGTTAAAVEKGPCLDLSWILLSVINLVLLYLALKQRSRHLINVERVRRHIASSGMCGVCRSGSEDMDHILRHCVKASSLWRSVLGYEAACSLDSLSFDVWLHGNISGGLAEVGGRKDWAMEFSIYCWLLWKLRCSMVLDSDFVEHESVLDRGRRLILECKAEFAASTRVPAATSDSEQRWEGPQRGWVKCNVDAAGSMLVVPPGRVALLVAADQKRCEEGGMAEG